MNKTIKRKPAKPKGHRRNLYIREPELWARFEQAARADRRSTSAWLIEQGRRALR